MPQGIIIFGLNGSGKTTLAKAVAASLSCPALDEETYYFLPSDIPFSRPRSREECHAALLQDIPSQGPFVLSATRGDCGEAINAMYALAILLSAPQPVRMERIRSRSLERFGDRVLPGGDMYEQEEKFFATAVSRSEAELEPFLQSLSCPVLRLDSTEPIPVLTDKIITAYRKIFPPNGI